MKSTSIRNNTTKHAATVTQDQITAALCELLAKQHGISLECSTVRYRGWHSTQTVDARLQHVWEIEVIVDHSKEASDDQSR